MKRFVSMMTVMAAAALVACFMVGCAPEKYSPAPQNPTIDAPVIGESGVLRVGVDTANPPFAGSLEDGSEILGLDVDVAAALADELGLSLEIVDTGANGVPALEAGDIDILMMTSQNTNDSALWISDPYIETAVGLFAGPENTEIPTPASNPLIAAQNTSMSAWAVENTFGEDALIAQNNLVSAFSSVEDGTANYVAADIVIGTYAAKTQNVDLSVVALLDNPNGYCVGVSSANTELQEAVSQALTTIRDGGVVKVIITKWLGAGLDLSGLSLVEGSVTEEPTDDEGVKTASEDGKSAGTNYSEESDNGDNGDKGAEDGSQAGANAVLPADGSVS